MSCAMRTVANLRNGSTFRLRNRTFEVTAGCFTSAYGEGFVEVPVFNEKGRKVFVKVRETDKLEVLHAVTADEIVERSY